MIELRDRLRVAYAGVLGADVADVALTTCTSDGVVRVLAGMELGPGDEVLTAPDEHPGLLGPLTTLRDAARRRHPRRCRSPSSPTPSGPRTKLVACSHVSWITGLRAPFRAGVAGRSRSCSTARRASARSVSTSASLGCDFYAGSGQKWMCGPIGSGMLWVAPEWQTRVAPVGATYVNLENASDGLAAELHPDARRYDSPGIGPETIAGGARRPRRPRRVRLARGPRARDRRSPPCSPQRLDEAGRTVAPRGETTLVSFEDADPEATRDRLAEAGIIVRNLPGTSYVRASVGAWNDEGDLERLLAAL